MSELLTRFGISMESELLARFDALIRDRHYTNRSEAIRDLIRRELVEEQWRTAQAPVIGTITVLYDHHTPNLTERLNALQHDFSESIIVASHVHLDHHNCLEVLIVSGEGAIVRDLADRLRSTRGVKHATLSTTTSGHDLP